jgi:adenosylcobyric acid synthase
MKPAKTIMILGTSSGAGKSFLATALCRWYARQGLRVAPFKAQNMSNNARVVATAEQGLGEIGSAQYFQAMAARCVPNVHMNPLLLKPEADTRSQVVLHGKVNQTLSHAPWHERSAVVWPNIAQSLDELRATHELVIIEGAGSPTEINLMHSDVVNLRVAQYARANCLLISDIDRGGAFAHLYGTWALLPEPARAQIKGFVLNKFRGDAALLEPAPSQLQALTSVATVATLPMWRDHGLPEEDGVFDSSTALGSEWHGAGPKQTIAIVAYPHLSNLDEFQVLKNLSGVRLVWARSAQQLASADWIILPGSKNTLSDLQWLRARGIDQAVLAHVHAAKPVLGICAGLQMLGLSIHDPLGVEFVGQPSADLPQPQLALGQLPLQTVFASEKTVRHTQATVPNLRGFWQSLSGLLVQGYEIHAGQSWVVPEARKPSPLFVQNASGAVLGTYLHGLFENTSVLQALCGEDSVSLEQVFERMADFVQAHFKPGCLEALLENNF